MDKDKQNAAPTAMGDGVSSKNKAGKLLGDSNSKPIRSTMELYATPAHKRVATVIAKALTLKELDGWVKARQILTIYLSKVERAKLAFHMLKTLHADDIEEVALKALGPAGGPLPTFVSLSDDANFWATMANAPKLEAYFFASYKHLPRHRQTKVLSLLNKEVA